MLILPYAYECLALHSCRQFNITKVTTPEICFVLILPYACECLALHSCRQFNITKVTTPEICFVLILPYAYECLALHSCRQFETVNTTTPEICFVLIFPYAYRVPRSLFVKRQTVFALCFMCKHKTSRRSNLATIFLTGKHGSPLHITHNTHHSKTFL